ncbi:MULTISPECIES: tRNA (adenine(22)-N(1))-methyltransferase [unclassified Paenibacillus]|uniref:tRNA (adenine(22)-N(1))-methyltransferase n=1 Tax=unclassified Paenibacillus TaxID=185978 RepID=UPI00070D0A62|nr:MULTISPECIES: class I SAM-dependent methyltransferase [unclassified Paenibacillus]KQX64767.1 SAM-dependent methyltransferase [Paenibacillus sp. Root444D2]KRE52020.1 SAM-dependent methyltransferase [Paenibacillus sp. Soil724D2]
MVKLSKRLQMIADRVPLGSKVADIGSDHALLPTYLAQQGIILFAVAGEVNPGPFEAATRQVLESGLSKKISVRSGDGLAVIEAGEVNVITIAGMGGSLMASILEAGKHKLQGVTHLILQPNVGEDHVRRWLLQQGWNLESETILEEDGKIYEILTAIAVPDAEKDTLNVLYAERQLPGGVRVSKERLLQMGPYFISEAPEVWFIKWESELKKLAMIKGQLQLSSAEASVAKAEQVGQEMKEIKEVLACLQKVKP